MIRRLGGKRVGSVLITVVAWGIVLLTWRALSPGPDVFPLSVLMASPVIVLALGLVASAVGVGVCCLAEPDESAARRLITKVTLASNAVAAGVIIALLGVLSAG